MKGSGYIIIRLECNYFKWPSTPEEALKINIEELRWILKGYEIRTKSKFNLVIEVSYF